MIELDPAYFDALVEIPTEFMAHISELGLNDVSFGIDPTAFIFLTNNLIQKTQRLQHLSLTPTKKKIEWISLLAENAPKLQHLLSLTISTEFPLET